MIGSRIVFRKKIMCPLKVNSYKSSIKNIKRLRFDKRAIMLQIGNAMFSKVNEITP